MKLKRGIKGYNHSGWSHYFDGDFQGFIVPRAMNDLHDHGFVSENTRESFTITASWARNSLCY